MHVLVEEERLLPKKWRRRGGRKKLVEEFVQTGSPGFSSLLTHHTFTLHFTSPQVSCHYFAAGIKVTPPPPIYIAADGLAEPDSGAKTSAVHTTRFSQRETSN